LAVMLRSALLALALVPALSVRAQDTSRISQAPGAADEQVWIDLRAPADGLVQTLPVGMVEVSGSTGAGRTCVARPSPYLSRQRSPRSCSGL